MRSVLLLVAALAFAGLAAADPQQYAVTCTAPNPASCQLRPYESAGWTARATVDKAAYNTTGWGRLYVEIAEGSTSKTMDEILAYSAGIARTITPFFPTTVQYDDDVCTLLFVLCLSTHT